MIRHNADGSITVGRECDLLTEKIDEVETVPTVSAESDSPEPKKKGRPKKK